MSKRSNKISIRLSDDELAQLAKYSSDASMSVSNYARHRLLFEPVRQTIVPEVNLNTYQVLDEHNRGLKAIGNNLNQTVKRLHSPRYPPNGIKHDLINDIEQVKKSLATTTSLIDQVKSSLVGVNKL